MKRQKNRRAERGNAMIIGVLAIVLAMALFALITDVSLLYATKSRMETYARETATAGATAIDLNGFTGTGKPKLIPDLAVTKATAYFYALKTGYTLVSVKATTTLVTVEISDQAQLYLIRAFVPISSFQIVVQASAQPQVGF